jgi:hypothetical protein
MKNKPEHAQELRRIGAAEAFIDARMALGRVAFSLADLGEGIGIVGRCCEISVVEASGQSGQGSAKAAVFF